MSKYKDENEYLDGEDRRPKLLPLILFIALIVIILVLVISCGMKNNNNNESSSSYLSYINLSNAKLSSEFKKDTYSYDVVATSDIITIACEAESSNAKTDGCNKRIELKEDKTIYTLKVTNGDKSKTYTLNITRRDTLEETTAKVSITSTKSSDGKSYLLSAIVEPSNLKVTYKWYKDDKEIPNSNLKNYTANETGNYHVEISNDELSLNIQSNELLIEIKKDEITNDKNSYTLKINNVKGNSSSWVKSVTLNINATASNGLASYAYSFDGGKTYQKSNSKTFTSNQTVKIVVKDSKGNTVNKSVKISKIDTTKPKVTLEVSNETSEGVVLNAKINPTSIPSGYKYEWYKDGKVIKGATSQSYKTNASGSYKVKVTTGSGNSTTSNSYNFITLSEKCPMISVTTVDGKYVPERFWVSEYIYIKITPPSTITKYDVYLNEAGKYDTISRDFTYFSTYKNTITLKVTNGGMRYVKIVTYDQKGNKTTCYSKVYYLR